MQRFSTDDVPERDRLAVVHEFVARHVAGRQFKLVDTNVRIEIAALDLPGQITVGAASYSPIIGTRRRELLADGRDDYLLTIHTADHELSVAGGPPIRVPAGDLMLVNEGTWSEFRLPQTFVKVVSLDRARLARLVPRIDMGAFYHIPGTAPGAALASGYFDLLHENQPQGEKARQVAANHLHDLVALVLDGFVKGGAGRDGRGIRAARLELVKKDILDRLRDPDMSIDSVARSQGITPRYVQRLFEADGLTFSEFLRDSRLDLAYRLLHETDPRDSTISAIAYDAGFHDLSNFNRVFRRRFGITPSDARAEAIRKRGR
jgi:AraC-like DNA-binding protein